MRGSERTAEERALPRGRIVLRTLLVLQLRDLRARGLHSPLPWLALAVVAVIACLVGGATIALHTADGTTSAFLGLVGLVLALVALHHLSRRIGAVAAVVSGVLLTAEGFAVVWLGHEGGVEVVIGAVLLVLGLVGTVRARARAGRPRRVLSLLLVSVGAALLLSSLLGVGGQYLDYRLNAGGFDCLEGFAGDPGNYPAAPSSEGGIRTGFSWNPIGRTCSWGAGAPAVTNGAATEDATSLQGDQVTSDWIYRLGAAGLVALALALGASARFASSRRARPHP